MASRLSVILVPAILTLAWTIGSSAQQPMAPQQPASSASTPANAPADAQAHDAEIHIDVSVQSNKGEPITGLAQQDFTLLDNKAAQPLGSFKAVLPGEEPAEVILLIDAVNTRFDTVAYEQGELQKFLKANPKLSHPTTIAVLGDKGAEIQKGFSTDGAALSKLLDGYTPGLREIRGSSGYWGATERLQISLTAAQQLTSYARTLPGRKVLIWISPGWPLLSGARVELDGNQQKKFFHDVVVLSTALRQARITLYNINPRGVNEPLIDSNYYKEFTKGVRKPSETQIGNLGLQVLAVQSGGLAIESDNDVSASLKQCFADTDSWYEITFPAPPAERPDEYHHLEVKLDKPGVTARTRDGYYAQPASRP